MMFLNRAVLSIPLCFASFSLHAGGDVWLMAPLQGPDLSVPDLTQGPSEDSNLITPWLQLREQWPTFEHLTDLELSHVYFEMLKDPELHAALFQSRNDINAAIFEKQTLATYAAQLGKVEWLDILAILGADLQGKDEKGNTPATTAAAHGQVSVIEALARHHVKLKKSDQHGLSPATAAATFGQILLLNKLFELGISPHCRDKNGRTPATAAAINKQRAILQVLSKIKSALSTCDKTGESPCTAAAKAQDLKTLKSLLRLRASPQRDANNNSPIAIAARNNDEGMILYLAEHQPNSLTELVLECVQTENVEILQNLLNAKVDFHKADKNGNTPFLVAKSVNKESVNKLLAQFELSQERKAEDGLIDSVAQGLRKLKDSILN